MNIFLNENWMDILHELQPSITEALGHVVKNIINNICRKIPYNDLWLHKE